MSNKDNSVKEKLLMTSISDFFSDENNMNKMLKYVRKGSPIPLRIFDWFVTNYAKKNNIVIKQKNGVNFNVYIKYKSELSGLRKQYFDPFCRGERINYVYETNKDTIKEKYIRTTVGQLNFFRWIIKYKILDYVVQFLIDIQDDINENEDKKKAIKINEVEDTIKRKPLTPSISKICNKRYPKGGITFKF